MSSSPTQQFLSHLHRGGQYSYWWTAQGRQSTWWEAGHPAPLPGGKRDTYFGIHPTWTIPTTNRRGEPREPAAVRSQIAVIAAVNCLFAEFDAKDFGDSLDAALAHVETLQPAPSVVIASGGGYHCYWLLQRIWSIADDHDRANAASIQARWVAYVGSDEGAKDLARVLRVPGTRNYKYDPAPTVAYVHCELDRLYELDDLVALLPAAPDSETPRPTSGPTPSSRAPEWAAKKLATAISMATLAADGAKHTQLLKAAALAGGCVPHLSEQEIETALYSAIVGRAKDPKGALDTIRDGITWGRSHPLTPPADLPALAWRGGVPYCPDCGQEARPSNYHDGLYCGGHSPAHNWRGQDAARPADMPPVDRPHTKGRAVPSYSAGPPTPTTAAALARKQIEPTRYYIPNMLRSGLALYIGNPGIGKTPALMQLALAFATGGCWLGSIHCRKSRVLYIGVEYDEAYIKEVLLDSAGTAELPAELFILSVDTFTSPTTAEESIGMLDYYLTTMGIEVIIIDVFSGFLPRENFKQNAYRGDYAEFLAYHRLCIGHKAILIGSWHGGKHNKDPETAYNGGQGMWGSAGGGRLTMFYDEDQAVRLRSQLRGHERKEWVLEQARMGGARFWSVIDADPDPIFGSDAQRRIYQAVKQHGSLAEPLTPMGVRAVLKADHPEDVPIDTYIRQTLGRLAERGILAKVGGGYVVHSKAGIGLRARGSAGSAGSPVTRGSAGSDSFNSNDAIHHGSGLGDGWIAPEGYADAESGGAIHPIHENQRSTESQGDPRAEAAAMTARLEALKKKQEGA